MSGCIEISVTLSEHGDVTQIERRVEKALGKHGGNCGMIIQRLLLVDYDASSQACRKVYETLVNDEDGTKELEWMNKSFININNGRSGVEFCNSDPPVEKYATSYLITLPTKAENIEQNAVRRDIVFRRYHDVIDGIGTLMLLNNFFCLVG
jgi:hypothetical protein